MTEAVTFHTVKMLIAGDESAFNLLYMQYSEKVYRLAFRFLKDKAQSEDIVQQTFINLWLSRDKLKADGNVWLYLFVIAKRLSLNVLREVYKSNDLFEKLLLNIENANNSTEEKILVNDLEKFAEKIINQLPKQQQMVFKLSRTEGLSHKEIADQLQISPNTVKNHMVMALKTLKAKLKYADLVYFYLLTFCL